MIRSVFMRILQLLVVMQLVTLSAYAVLAGGRPNSISGGQNAFAGVVNPANAVWIVDRFDVGCFVVHQKISFNNRDDNPLFPPGKINQAYKVPYLATADIAIHKHFQLKEYDSSISLAFYTTPGFAKIRTKEPFPVTGTTPVKVENKTQVLSSIFSLKLNDSHSIGFSLDYFYLSHSRSGFQRTDNPLRSVSPGHVTNKGLDHSGGLGFSLGWHWNITKSIIFGCAYVKKSSVGTFRKYRGFEPHHGKNYTPETLGAGFTYLFNEHIAGRLEVLWTGFGSLPNANNTLLPNGQFNLHKRGSNKSPGAGLQDATFINCGLGYRFNAQLSLGMGLSHRIKLRRKSPYIISRSYTRQTTYDLLSFGLNYNCLKHDFFFSYSHGFENRQSGTLPQSVGGGKFISKKTTNSFSLAWGYLY